MAQEIGSAKAIQGQVTAIGPEGSRTLAIGSPVFKGDTLATAKGSAGSIQFLDKTVLNVGEGSKVSLDQYVYDASKGSGQALFKMAQGTFRAVTGEIVKHNPESFKMQSPLATIGIRGTETAHAVPAPGQPNASESHLVMVFDGKPVIVQPLGGGAFQVLSQAGVKVEVGKFGAGPVMVMTPQEFKYFQALTTTGVQQGVTRDTISPQGQQTKDPKVQGAQDAATKATADAQAKAAAAAAAKAAAETAAKAAAEAAASGDPAAKAAADAAAKAAADAAAKAALDAKAAAELAAKAQADAFAAQQAMALAEAAKAAADAAAKAALETANQSNTLTLNPGSVITFTTTTNSSGQTTTVITVTQGGGSQSATGGVIISDQAGSTTVIDTTHDNDNDGNNGQPTVITTLDLSASEHPMEVDLLNQSSMDLTSHQSSSVDANIVNVVGSSYDDVLIGNASANNLSGGDGNDTIYGGGGADSLYGGAGDDVLTYMGQWTVVGGAGVLVDPGTGVDSVTTGIGSDAIFMGTALNNADGQDTIDAGLGHDVLYFTDNGHDSHDLDTTTGVEEIILGDAATNIVFPNSGTFGSTQWGDIGGVLTVDGHALTAGNSMVFDGSGAVDGAFSIIGGAGNDTLTGGHGNDTILGGAGNDTIDGGNNDDTVSYASSTSGVTVSLAAGTASDGLGGSDSLNSIEHVTGSAYADSITGNDAANILSGGAGSDTITGGVAADTVTGGSGADTFVFNAADLAAGDSITDATAADTLEAHGSFDFTTATGVGGFGTLTMVGDGNTVSFTKGQLSELTNINFQHSGSGADKLVVYLDSTHHTVDASCAVITGNIAGDSFEFHGTSATDSITGSSLADSIVGSQGYDTINGGAGTDVLNYTSIQGLVGVSYTWTDIGTGSGYVVLTGDGQTVGLQSFTGIENVIGATGGTLHYQGGAGNVAITGTSGNDTFNFGVNLTSGDTIDGGLGHNTLLFTQQNQGGSQTADLAHVSNIDQITLGDASTSLVITDAMATALQGSQSYISIDGSDITSPHSLVINASAVTNAADAFHFSVGTGEFTLTGGAGDDAFLLGESNTGHVQTTSSIDGGNGTNSLSIDADMDLRGVTITKIQEAEIVDGAHVIMNASQVDATTGMQQASAIDLKDGSILEIKAGATATDYSNLSVLLESSTLKIDAHSAGGLLDLSTLTNVTVDNAGNTDNYIEISGSGANDTFNLTGLAPLFSHLSLDGGAGTNAITFAGAAAGVEVDLSAADISNIQLVTGSSHSDSITGDDGDTTFDGGGSVDTALGDGSQGDPYHGDTIYGGGADTAGDTISYQNLTTDGTGITLNLSDLQTDGNSNQYATATYHDAGGHTYADALYDIRNITGTAHADSLGGDFNANVITAGAGNDTILGSEGDDTISGGAGIDTLSFFSMSDDHQLTIDITAQTVIDAFGGGSTQVLSSIEIVGGGAGDDSITGSSGNDTIVGSEGEDTLHGGDGTDTLDYSRIASDFPLIINIGAGTVTNGLTQSFDGFEHIIGGQGEDTITGSANFATVIEGGTDDDTLTGGGKDTLSYEHDEASVTVNLDQLTANDGSGHVDDISGGGFINLTGSAYNDFLIGDTGDNVIEGGAGNDTLKGGLDTVPGADGLDTVSYEHAGAGVTVGLGPGTATGGAGTDTFSGFENILGSRYTDGLSGDEHDNVIEGLGTSSTIVGSGDTLDGGSSGTDTVSYEHLGAAVHLTLDADGNGSATYTIAGTSHEDELTAFTNIIGSALNDSLTGNDSDNVIEGGLGNDTLHGGGGTDTLSFAQASAAVTVTLANGGTGTVTTASTGTDTYDGFENLMGTAHGDVLTGNSGNNALQGLAGNDTLIGTEGNDYLYGDGGVNTVDYHDLGTAVSVTLTDNVNDDGYYEGSADHGIYTDQLLGISNIIGTALADAITGNSDNNVIEGRGANTATGSDHDVLDGGGGSDTLSYATLGAGVTLSMPLGTGTYTLGGAIHTDQFSNFETIIGSAYADTIETDGNSNTVNAGAGDDLVIVDAAYGTADTIDGGDGNDTINLQNLTAGVAAGLAFDQAVSVPGHPTNIIAALSHFENIIGTNYDDSLTGGFDDNVLEGLAGDDELYGYMGNDTASYEHSTGAVTASLLTETASDGFGGTDTLNEIDNLTGSAHADLLTGDTSANVLKGLGDDDTIYGGAGNDSLDGGSGTNTLFGDAGDDLLIGGGSGSALDGGADTDTVSYADYTDTVTVNLTSNYAHLGWTGSSFLATDTLANIENIIGSAHNDYLFGTLDSNAIQGGLGNDTICGGNNHLNGGAVDTLSGGTGSDVFHFRTTGGSTVITDFEHGTDKISLYTGGGFAALSGTWAFSTVANGSHSGSDTNAALTYDTGDHTLYYDADGTGAGAAVAVASFSNSATVTQSDIVVTAVDHTGH